MTIGPIGTTFWHSHCFLEHMYYWLQHCRPPHSTPNDDASLAIFLVEFTAGRGKKYIVLGIIQYIQIHLQIEVVQ
jgi:hypothetical protein